MSKTYEEIQSDLMDIIKQSSSLKELTSNCDNFIKQSIPDDEENSFYESFKENKQLVILLSEKVTELSHLEKIDKDNFNIPLPSESQYMFDDLPKSSERRNFYNKTKTKHDQVFSKEDLTKLKSLFGKDKKRFIKELKSKKGR